MALQGQQAHGARRTAEGPVPFQRPARPSASTTARTTPRGLCIRFTLDCILVLTSSMGLNAVAARLPEINAAVTLCPVSPTGRPASCSLMGWYSPMRMPVQPKL